MRWNWIPNQEGQNDLAGINDPMAVALIPPTRHTLLWLVGRRLD